MQRWTIPLPLVALGLTSCNTPKFDLVSIRPIYGWVDGCTSVKVGGASFGSDLSFAMGGVDTPIVERGSGIDEGYWFTAVTPAATGKGYVPISVTQNGETLTIEDAYYYVECPMPGYIEGLSASDVASGDTVGIVGCGLDTQGLKVKLVTPGMPKGGTESDLLSLTSICGSAQVSFTAPALADGTYDVLITDGSGTLVYPADYGCIPDSATSCLPVFSVTYGGGS